MTRLRLAGQGDAGRRADITSVAAVGAMVALMLVMLGRVAQLQVAPSEALAAHIDERITTVREPGVRGDILDRRGRLLAGTRFGYRVFVDPVRFPSPPDEAMQRLSEATGISLETIAEKVVGAMAENERRAAMAKSEPASPQGPLASLYELVRGGEPMSGAGEAIEAEEEGGRPKRQIRYVPLGRGLEDWRVDVVRGLKIPGVHLELRPVRELPAPELTTKLVGAVGVDHDGLLGAELLLEGRIKATPGRLRYVRDARSRPLWVERGGYVAPVRGEDVRLSIDLELQRIAHEELTRAIEECDAAGARLVLLDPISGEIVAMLDLVRRPPDAVEFDWDNPPTPDGPRRRFVTIKKDPSEAPHPALARNRCVEDVYEPGSTFKAFMWSATTALGLADVGETVNTEGGVWTTPYGRAVRDVVRRDKMTWGEVLVNSSNVGMAKVTRRMSDKQMRDAVVRFGFGSRTGIGLPGESPGIVTSQRDWTKYTQTSVAMGYEVAVTPVQMVRAFSAFARTGELAGTMVTPRLLAAEGTGAAEGVRVLPARVAELTRETMRGVTHNLDERLARANKGEPPPRYELFGKSGTAKIPMGSPPEGKRRPRGWKGYFEHQYITSFIAAGPAESPRLVCLVVIDDPGPQLVRENRYYGAQTAGPVVRRVMERALAYLGVPASYPEGAAALN